MTADTPQEAVANARRHTEYPPGFCLRFVREAWEVGPLYRSAIDAWHAAVRRHPGDRQPPLGAPLFYEGGTWGHIVIATGPAMRSTDCRHTGQVSEATIAWPEQNWGQRYLGWTEDINGVQLPLTSQEEEEEMTEEDWTKLRKIVAEEVARNNPEVVDKVWFEQMTVTAPSGEAVDKSTRQVLRETWQKVAKGLNSS